MIELSLAVPVQPASGPVAVLSALALIALVVFLCVAAERSVHRQQGRTPRRGQAERNAAGRVLETFFRW